MAVARPRTRQKPAATFISRASLPASAYSVIDSLLRDLKTSCRQLQSDLDLFHHELRLLERVYYKGKNQHRPALFWKRVHEVRRYAQRLDEMGLSALLDAMRYSFYGQESPVSVKTLRGAWTCTPNEQTVHHVLERLDAALALLFKGRERLRNAYSVLLVAMQGGAFLHLVLTLVAITCRLDTLTHSLTDVLFNGWTLFHRLYQVLNVSFDS
ncbi:hypothetical protein FISHEDRAFT_38374 [Fistulina hepatica ATCC 64428]|nr:hypothetical protein FISHEDRAFT_38374 [Fistulina hepatica ATCC 64428]